MMETTAKTVLQLPKIDKKTSRRFDLRAFVRRVSYDGAKLWHSLPLDLRDLNNLALFKKGIRACNF